MKCLFLSLHEGLWESVLQERIKEEINGEEKCMKYQLPNYAKLQYIRRCKHLLKNVLITRY